MSGLARHAPSRLTAPQRSGRCAEVATMSDYIAATYWRDIYAAGYDESAVGYPSLSRSINRARYDVERRNVARALDSADTVIPRRVLDVGSGTGIWIDFWKRRGAHEIVGVDLTSTAVDRLRARFPEHEFRQLDIGDATEPLPSEMDVVSAMSVLLHITDDARFERALERILGCVRPGGIVVLVEPAVVHRWWGKPFGPESNSKARSLSSYTSVFSRVGFTLVDLRPTSCLLSNVIDTRRQFTFHVLELYWDLLTRLVGRRERRGHVVGALLRPLDVVATSLLPNGPSSKVIVARRIPLSTPPSDTGHSGSS